MVELNQNRPGSFIKFGALNKPNAGAGERSIYHESTQLLKSEVGFCEDFLGKLLEIGAKQSPALAQLLATKAAAPAVMPTPASPAPGA